MVDGADLALAGPAGRDPGADPSGSPGHDLTACVVAAVSGGPHSVGLPLGCGPVKLREQRVAIPAPDGEIQAIVIEPVGPPPRRGVLYYTDIFQLTESTLRTARQLASAGFLVCLPEIYPRELAGVALEFDDPGKQAGLAAAAATTTAQFDADTLGGPGLPRAARRPRRDRRGRLLPGRTPGVPRRVRPAGRGHRVLLPDRPAERRPGPDDAGSLAEAARISGRLMVIFGSNDPHVPADARLQILTALYAAGLEHLELHVYQGGEHAFMRDIGPRHDPVLTDLSLTEAISFLRAR